MAEEKNADTKEEKAESGTNIEVPTIKLPMFSGTGMIVMVSLMVVQAIVLGGIFMWWFGSGQGKTENSTNSHGGDAGQATKNSHGKDKTTEHGKVPQSAGQVVTFGSKFQVGFPVPPLQDYTRYLIAEIKLQIDKSLPEKDWEMWKARVESERPWIRDHILTFFESKGDEYLLKIKNRKHIKETIRQDINKHLEEEREIVSVVYFTEYLFAKR